jgi:hypothetical protein
MVADAGLTAAAASLSGSANSLVSGATVATFTDANTASTVADFTAKVTWDDGSTSAGTITGSGGSYTVTASHLYTNAGSFPLTVDIYDNGGSWAEATSTATISGALSAQSVPITATEGTSTGSVLVATFTDTGSTGNPGDYTVSVNWGDGHISNGSVASNGSGGFNITGSNTYGTAGQFPIAILITNIRGAKATLTSAVAVSDAALTATGTTLTGTPGAALSTVTVAQFTDPNANGALTDYSASIDWGDGNTSDGVITLESGNTFAVSGTNTYVQPGTYTVTVFISDVGGASIISTSTVTVASAPPVITGLSALGGPTSGGVLVTIFGTALSGATAVSFGGTAATQFQVNADGSIGAVAPAHAAGTVDITVTTPAGSSSPTAADQYSYVSSAPTVTAVSPASGPTGGANTVTITGTNFAVATQVYFGATPATSFTITSATSITAVVPAQLAGSVDVTVASPFGVSATSGADTYTYVGTAPTVTALDLTAGPAAGGTVVTLTGTNLNGASGVSFGGTAAASFTVYSPTKIVATAPAGTAGTVDVTVTSPYGTSGTSAADQFTFVTAPTVTSLGTASGPTGGGTSVAITGTNFTGASAVFFGSAVATSFTVNSATSITAVAPAQTAGIVDVTVVTAGGTSATGSADQFTYTATAPTVSAVSPNLGPTAGGTSVVLTGTSFNGATQVSFGATAATSFVVDSPTQITATAPAESAATIDVTVTTPYGTSTTGSADHFTYADAAAPVVSSLSASSGAMAGGTSVVITGTGFNAATQVLFGGTPATSFTVNSSTQITATSPAQGAGAVDVSVTTSYGSSALSVVDWFTYTAAAPTVTGISPSTGTTAGGTVVTISGSNFTGATKVLFGGAPAPSFTVNSDVSITATAPVQATGTFDVTVVNPWGTSATGSADHYTYTAASGNPTVTSLGTSSGPTGGGTSVTITGTNFTGATAVAFGLKLAVSFTVTSATSITAVAPAALAGTVDVTVTTAAGISSTSASDHYTYTGTAPTVTAVSPSTGPTTGGTTVTVTGTNFNGATQVKFGSTAATSFTDLSSTELTAVAPAGTAGVTDITVTTPYGTSSTGAADHFTYQSVPVPTVTAVSPSGGPVVGGNLVTVTGTGFTNATAVAFGHYGAASFTVVSDTQIVVTAPAQLSAATVDVTVTTASGTSSTSSADHFSYSSSAPTVSALSVASGSTAGGTSVVITGTNFTGATQVSFGGVAASSFTVNSATQITATAPAQAAGVVDILVTTPNGTSAPTTFDQFTYSLPAPTVTALSPTSGATGGGTLVTVTGTSFTGATKVLFGTTPAELFVVNSATSISAVSPALVAGTVDVTVVTPSGTSATSSADHFTASSGANTPAVTGLSATSGSIGGGGSVTITGTNLAGATEVLFGGVAATSVTVNSATQITVVVPPASATGTVDVTVVTYGGISAPVSADHYTYTATAPTVTAVSPNTGDTAGGGTVTVTGTHFLDGVSAVSFGGTPASFSIVSDITLTAVAPVGAPGTVDVTVTNAAGTSATSSADHYTYTADPSLPTVTGLSPTSGPTGGSTSVTVTGTNFSNVEGVSFGSVAASFTVNSATSITAVAPFASAGTVDVTVTTSAGTSAAVSADHYTYTGTAPTVSAVSPASGSTLGGTQVVLTGTNLNGATQVTFGTTAATAFTVNSSTQITATAPALSAGVVDVTVTTPYGTSANSSADHYTALAVPTVTSLGTTSGYAAGGTVLTVTGTNFTGLVAVTFGGVPASAITVNSSTQLTVTSPAGTAGTVDVVVTTAAGSSATGTSDQFTYLAAATITSINPTEGPTAGGTGVTITGSGFTGVTAVKFGSVSSPGFTIVSDTTISAAAPAQSAGTVDVTVTNSHGTSATSAADQYTYAALTVTGVSPSTGPMSGGTLVSLTGTGFLVVTQVQFGSSTATSFTIYSDTSMTVVSPAGFGTVDIQVITSGSSSPTSSADKFTYTAHQDFAGVAVMAGPDVLPLTEPELRPLVQEAIVRWTAATGDPQTAAVLARTQIVIADLPANVLGLESGQTVWIDVNAAGHGWFVDPTPHDDSEFPTPAGGHELQAAPGTPAAARVDLLTVITHELGHRLGLGDLDPALVPHDLETLTLGVGVRRLPAWVTAAPVAPAPETVPSLLPAGPPSLVLGELSHPGETDPLSLTIHPRLVAALLASSDPSAFVTTAGGLTPGLATTAPALVASSGLLAGAVVPAPMPTVPLATAAHLTEALSRAFLRSDEEDLTWLTTTAAALTGSAAMPDWTAAAANPISVIAPAGGSGGVPEAGKGDSLGITTDRGDVLVGGIAPENPDALRSVTV